MWNGIGIGIGRQRFGGGIFSAYAARVTADGGITEAGECVDAVSALMQTASLLLVPSGYKEDIVYSQIPTSGAGDLSFTRASNGTRVNSDGLVEVVAWNLVTYSEDFTNTIWSKANGITATANTATAPNGTTTAYTLEKTGGSGGSNYYYIVAATNTFAQLTNFFYVKHKSGSGIVWLLGYNSGSFAFYDVVNGTALSKSSGMTTSIESVGNGWYKCIFSQDYTSASSTTFGIGVCLADGTPNYDATSAATQSVYIWGAQSNIGSTAKPYFPTTDRLNVPRLTYQNGGGGCPSLLLEKQSTNILLRSEEFNLTWSIIRLSVTPNTTIGPDGNTTADSLIENTATATRVLRQPVNTTVSSYTFSVYAKANTRNWIYLSNPIFGSTWFDLSNGTIGFTPVGVTASITNVGDGWYRCAIGFTATNALNNFDIGLSTGNLISVYTGDGVSGVYVWGAQVELGAYATSYIPTTTASATRVADSCFKTGISSLIGQTEGTFFVMMKKISILAEEATVKIDNGTLDTSIRINFAPNTPTTTRLNLYANKGNVLQTYSDNASFQLQNTTKVAVGYAENNLALYANGVQVFLDSSFPTFTSDNLSRLTISTGIEVDKILLFNTRLTNAELATLTTL
jgi:hypothetical protein